MNNQVKVMNMFEKAIDKKAAANMVKKAASGDAAAKKALEILKKIKP